MKQYISKSAVVAEIEKCYNECLKRAKIARIIDSNYWNTKAEAYRNVLVILDNTLEVKEVDLEECQKENIDLEKEVNQYFEKTWPFEENDEDIIAFARHFFELGLKVQKGE